MGIDLMGTICEMAWSQGVDLYAADDYRFRKACEYVARYNLGHDDVPYTTYNNCDNVNQTVPGTGGRGQERPVWERVFHHYWGPAWRSTSFRAPTRARTCNVGGSHHSERALAKAVTCARPDHESRVALDD